MELEERVLCVAVLPKGKEIYDEMCTLVTIVDESGGEFVEVSQTGRGDLGKIAINPEEWPAIRSAIDRRISECREEVK